MDHTASANTILLVEDNQADVILTLRAFKKSGFTNEIRVVYDGQEALDYLFSTGPWTDRTDILPPAVVLLDLKLPRVSGLDVLRQLRANPRTHQQPVVILTSSREDQDLLEGYELGANAYVRKPVDFVEFVQAAHALGFFWLLVNEPPPRG